MDELSDIQGTDVSDRVFHIDQVLLWEKDFDCNNLTRAREMLAAEIADNVKKGWEEVA